MEPPRPVPSACLFPPPRALHLAPLLLAPAPALPNSNATWNSAGAPVPMINATLPKEEWTLNMGAEEGSEEDA